MSPDPIIGPAVAAAKHTLDFVSGTISRRRLVKEELSKKFRQALTEMEIYEAGLTTRQSARSATAEAELARKWSDASLAAAHSDKELSDVCLAVSRYCANPPEDPAKSIGQLVVMLQELLEEKREDGVMFA